MTADTTFTTMAVMRTHTDVHDLRHHGDAEVRDCGPGGLTDLAVNVRAGTPRPGSGTT